MDVPLVPFSLPDLAAAELEGVQEVLESGWITTGPRTIAFEQAFAAYLGVGHALAVNSGTAAMHLALEAIGIERGDIVLTSPYTFAATSEVIRYFDALPVFVDVSADTLNLDPECLSGTLDAIERGDFSTFPAAAIGSGAVSTRTRKDIRSRLKAVMPVHVGGHPCDLEPIYQVAREHGLAVVEDAAHALPSRYRKELIGSSAILRNDLPMHAVCFSFYATKTLTTGEGGMLVSDNEALVDRCRIMSLHGISKDAWGRYSAEGSWYYEILAPGFKYNMTDIAAAIGLGQLQRLDEMCARRSAVAAAYDRAFAGEAELETPTVRGDVQTSWHLYALRLNLDTLTIDRAGFVEALRKRGIGASVHFIPLHLHPLYRDLYGFKPEDFPVAHQQYTREVSLPIYSRLSDEDVERVISATLDVVQSHRR